MLSFIFPLIAIISPCKMCWSFLLKNALEFDALCQVWMKFAHLISRRRIFILKCEKFTDKNNFCNEFTVGTAPIPFLVKQKKK